jgi:uncharacterized lipoprotein YmbA
MARTMRGDLTRGAAILTGCALLAACGHSAPTRFFTLDPVPTARPAAAGLAMGPVQLDAVRIPPDLDRPQVVTQIGANRVAVHDLDQWASPLGGMMRRTLAQNLLARLPAGAFILPDAPAPVGVRGLVVDVLQLEARPDGEVVMQASWTLMAPGVKRAALTRDVQLSAQGGPGPQGAAAATSALLGQLADQIAATLGAPASD